MKKLVGVFAAAALLGSGVTFAQSDISKDTQQQQGASQGQSGQGGSGSMQGSSSSSGSMTQGSSSSTGGSGAQGMAGEKELTGRVVKSSSKTVWVEDPMGAVIPLELEKSTQFTDPSLKSAKSLKEGQEIRANFEVKETRNVAKSITPSSGTGGSGAMSPDSSINQGTGGSGMEQNKNVGGSGSSSQGSSSQGSSMNPDKGSSSSPDTY